MAKMRLNRFLSDAGVLSRRAADRAIEAGEVFVNGRPALLGEQIDPATDDIVYKQRHVAARLPEDYVYIALNKPTGIICTGDPKARDNIIRFLDYPERVFTVGRLDVASEGLILLTNNGAIVNQILRAGNAHEKEYRVRVNRPIPDAVLKKMAEGVPILNTVTRPCQIFREGPAQYRIILTQGLNRQIRRMAEYFGFEVKALRRLRIMNIELGPLKTGQWRYLTEAEKKGLFAALKDSSSNVDQAAAGSSAMSASNSSADSDAEADEN